MKKRTIYGFFIALFAVTLFTGCGKTITMSSPENFDIHTEKQREALDAGIDNFLKFAFGTKEWSAPEKAVLTWETGKEKPDSCILRFSDNAELKDAKEISTAENSFAVGNLEIGKTYYWQVEYENKKGKTIKSEIASFTTDDKAPRNLFVDGVTNVRDLGGWKTENGHVKQGLVFRSARLNDNGKETVSVTEDGIRTMKEELGIKTELDLRQGEIRTSSALGEDVNYVNIPIPGTVTTQLRMHDESVKKVFTLFADENNYPILVHCSVGTDRTGLVSFMLNGLLGVAEEELYIDYAFSNFGKIGSLRKYEEIRESYVSVIKQFPGASLSEQIENYLKEVGITDAQINEIKRIMKVEE
ncbi:MAG: tyrosine-protein phosphatase [Lachnospiraceae bacterium]|nr:tyrosine-protein phosphatase [Lachnospiraceae bacterium]